MNDFLKKYDVVIRTVGPVFIGSGREIGKKEYLFLGNDKVAIFDMQKFYTLMKKKGKANAFEKYMISNSRDNLKTWLDKEQIRSKELEVAFKYKLDCGDAIIEKGKNIQVMECMKNPYGEPFIPGTSLKGMFRNVLICQDIINHPKKYQQEKKSLEEVLRNDYRINKKTYLKKNSEQIEAINYRVLDINTKNTKDAVNDIMKGFIVSDSEPLSVDDLVLCQKVERHIDGTEKTLPILRECIKPGVEIRFTITVDTSVCNYNGKKIASAIDTVINNYYLSFQKVFAGIDMPQKNYLFLGGGSGFVSKTIVYSMYNESRERGMEVTQKIFDKTGVPRNHKHNKDKEYGASPHILKCTRYQGKTFQMGLCKLVKMVR